MSKIQINKVIENICNTVDNNIICHSERSEVPWAGRPLSGTLRVPPLPLQRESILPEGWFTAKMNAIKKPKRKF